MISTEYVRMMARYNQWQNANLYGAADTLTDVARRTDRSAFFRSIHGTLNHLLWGDLAWMHRFDGWDLPEVGISDSPDMFAEWDELKAVRQKTDAGILDWANRVADTGLAGDLGWNSMAVNRKVTKPMAMCVTHFFNHQTHHRGQVHAMLTAAGARPGDTDVIFMPEDA